MDSRGGMLLSRNAHVGVQCQYRVNPIPCQVCGLGLSSRFCRLGAAVSRPPRLLSGAVPCFEPSRLVPEAQTAIAVSRSGYGAPAFAHSGTLGHPTLSRPHLPTSPESSLVPLMASPTMLMPPYISSIHAPAAWYEWSSKVLCTHVVRCMSYGACRTIGGDQAGPQRAARPVLLRLLASGHRRGVLQTAAEHLACCTCTCRVGHASSRVAVQCLTRMSYLGLALPRRPCVWGCTPRRRACRAHPLRPRRHVRGAAPCRCPAARCWRNRWRPPAAADMIHLVYTLMICTY